MDIKIKEATFSDIDELMKWRIEVLKHVFEIPESQNINYLYKNNKEYYSKSLKNGSHVAVFAVVDGIKVGCGGICFYNEMPSPDNHNGKCGYIMNIYTIKQYRSHGVGKKIVNYLINTAHERGVHKIYLETSNDGRPLYEKLGFREMEDYLKFKE